MRNKLLFTTALAGIVLIAADAFAERIEISQDENKNIASSASGFGSEELQGGVALNQGKLSVGDNLVFDGNKGIVGGVVSTVNNTGEAIAETVIGNKVSFNENTSAMQGGAIHNQRAKTTVGNNAKFLNNTAVGYGGGAVYQDTDSLESVLTIGDNAEFSGNESQSSHGGAVMNFNAGDKAEIILGKNAVFFENTAGKAGGAIANWGGEMTVGDNASFTDNSAAANGGAVYNDDYGKSATMVFNGSSVFENNTATGEGGAIYNAGSMTMGDVVFSGNKAGGKLNDIHNTGTMDFTGNVTLDGGISGDGTVTFAKDTVLTVKTDVTAISNNVVNKGAELSLVFENGYGGGSYSLITEDGSLDKEFNITDNALYDIKSTANGTYEITKKDTADSGNIAGANNNQMRAINAITSGASNSERFNAVADHVSALLQSADRAEVQRGIDAVAALSPEAAPMVLQSQTQTAGRVFGAVASRLSGGSLAVDGEGAEGMSSGDSIFERVVMWIQGLWSNADYDGSSKSNGYDADSAGVALGFEKHVNDQVKLGVGYAYTNTDIDGFMRSTDVDTHTAILYGEYKPSNWYVNAVASYGWSDYSEDKNVAGLGVSADYDVETFGLQTMAGYEMSVKGFNLTPEAGLRYLHISQDGYRDTADQRVSANDSDILTGVIGAKAGKDFVLENETVLRPEVRLAVTYDMFRDDGGSAVRLANGSAYIVDGEALDRLAVEFGAGLTAELNDNVEMSLKYEGQFRDDYEDHTGLLNIKYKF